MMLDSFDIFLQRAVNILVAGIAGGPLTADNRLWLALTNAKAFPNTIEELLEYLTAVALLMFIGNLYSVGVLGCTPAEQKQYADQH